MHFEEKHKGSTGGLQRGTTNANSVPATFKQNIKPDRTKRNNIDRDRTERMASGWMTIWRLDTGELKRFGKGTRAKDGGSNGILQLLRGRSPKESEEMSLLERAYEN